MRLLFDLESDGLLDIITKIHCISAQDVDTDEEYTFTPDNIEEGIDLLSKAEELIGHNIISFDIPAIKKVYPDFTTEAKITDTLVLSKLIFSNLYDLDVAKGKVHDTNFKVFNKSKQVYESAVGRHSLEAWGLRLKELKGDFGHNTDWSEFTPEMLGYNIQDRRVNRKFYDLCLSKNYSQDAIDLEMEVQAIIDRQVQVGIEFDVEKALILNAKLTARRDELESELQSIFPGWFEQTKTPEYYEYSLNDCKYKAAGKKALEDHVYSLYKDNPYFKLTRKAISESIVAGPIKQKHIQFNPGSRAHILRVFQEKYNWVPTEFTDKDNAIVDEDVLSSLEFVEAKVLCEYFVVQKRLSMLSEGKGNWLGYERNGRIHGRVDTLGTVTHRATHSSPNISQTPSMKKTKRYPEGMPYGKECRELFKAAKGYSLVGSDASGQELRCLAHFMAEFDDGEYGKIVVGGDPHTVNQKAAGLSTRADAKQFVYAWLYGAGDCKIGSIVHPDYPMKVAGVGRNGSKEMVDNPRLVRVGKALKKKFLQSLPALKALKEKITEEAKEFGHIRSIDGRIIQVRSPHAALNCLFQSTGSILTKRWIQVIDKELKLRGLHDKVRQVCWSHDEVIMETRKGYEEEVAQICKDSMKKVEQYYNFKCELDADAKWGESWYDIH